MTIYHNSQDEKYRYPFGAVSAGDEVLLSLEIFRHDTPYDVKLVLICGEEKHHINMTQKFEDNGKYIYTCKINAPMHGALLWYYFIVEADYQRYYYAQGAKALGGAGCIYMDESVPLYQITVSEKGFKTPNYFKHSIMYQIFPDRFYKGSGNNKNEEIVKKRPEYTVHADWYEPLAYTYHPHEDGLAANDFYGGNLKGIMEKLPYLKSMGISIIYLNPVFDAYSNHKYDTADYMNIDPMFGDNAVFAELCEKALEYGIRIILDGVFSHTGADSIYFNKYGNYGENIGAYRDKNSPFRPWFQIDEQNNYESWWGVTTLPNVNELEPSYVEYMLTGENAVVKYWLEKGASGWRLDVADELPDEFIEILRREVKKKDSEAIIIGEVWEEASNKLSYGKLRKYLLGKELDSVMNYPFKDALISFLLGHQPAQDMSEKLMSIFENYPKESVYSLMNLLGGHDVARIKTVMGEMYDDPNKPLWEKQNLKLPETMETLAIKRVRLASLIQMTFPGVPCIYYGDEIGMQGFRDPLNRMPFTWRCIDPETLEWYRGLTEIRNSHPALRTGGFKTLYAMENVYVYAREIREGRDEFGVEFPSEMLVIAVNRGGVAETVELSVKDGIYENLLTGGRIESENDTLKIKLSPYEGTILKFKKTGSN